MDNTTITDNNNDGKYQNKKETAKKVQSVAHQKQTPTGITTRASAAIATKKLLQIFLNDAEFINKITPIICTSGNIATDEVDTFPTETEHEVGASNVNYESEVENVVEESSTQAIEPKMFPVDEQKSITTASVINNESTQSVETPQRKRPRKKSKESSTQAIEPKMFPVDEQKSITTASVINNETTQSVETPQRKRNRNACDESYEKSESSEKKKATKAFSYHNKRYVPQKMQERNHSKDLRVSRH
jgi:hypothetical protein